VGIGVIGVGFEEEEFFGFTGRRMGNKTGFDDLGVV